MFNKETGERCLAYPTRVLEIIPIPGPPDENGIPTIAKDRDGNPYTKVEYAKVLGWWCIVKVGEFKVGDWAIYFEIDSQTPEKPEYEFLRPRKFRIRTQKMCTVLSQGLCLRPIEVLPVDFDFSSLSEELDLTAILGVVKYEPGEGQNNEKILPGFAKGKFPSFIKRTDQERIQNLTFVVDNIPFDYEVTEKLDGASISIYNRVVSSVKEDGSIELTPEFGVCSRRLELKLDTAGNRSLENNVGDYVSTVLRLKLDEKIKRACTELKRNLAFQNEFVGPGVQKNKYQLKEHDLRCFDIWDIDEHCYILPTERREICAEYNISHVPIIDVRFNLRLTVEQMLEMAVGKTVFGNNPNQQREGLVFKHNAQNFSFKAISNIFLLEGK